MTSLQRPFSIGLCFPFFFSSLRFHFAAARYIYILCNEFSEKEKVHVEPPVILRAQWKRKPPNPKKDLPVGGRVNPNDKKKREKQSKRTSKLFFSRFYCFQCFSSWCLSAPSRAEDITLYPYRWDFYGNFSLSDCFLFS